MKLNKKIKFLNFSKAKSRKKMKLKKIFELINFKKIVIYIKY